MMVVFYGNDTDRVKKEIHKFLETKKERVIWLTDASPIADVSASLSSGGFFSEKKTVVLDRVSSNEAIRSIVVPSLTALSESSDVYIWFEEKFDASTKKQLEKLANKITNFDTPKQIKQRPTVFAMVNYLRAHDKKSLWISYQVELAAGNAPEAIHGVLFWGVKQMLLQARNENDTKKAKNYLIELTELPHEARRRGEDLEYALERFVLTV